jgi:PAS domain S-box-containing protein
MRELKEKEEKFQKAFQASAAGISITRLSDSKYMEVNDTFIKMTGFSTEELINHSSVELGIVVSMEKREEVLEQVRKHGNAKNFEMTIRHKNGTIFEILSSVETILLNGEKFAINIIYDITERKRAEQQLEAANKELESFSYSVSHDLRAPLRSINGYASMLYQDYNSVIDETGLQMIAIIKSSASKMGKLIDDLLTFSRLGRKELMRKELNMNELVENVINEINTAYNHKAKFKVDTLIALQADYSLLYQVVFNLISNAIKYSSKKENPLVEISSEQNNNEVIFVVKDNGSGFDMKYSGKLFGVFQRLHSEEEFEGTGVGLAIVQRIINKHGGKAWAEGKVNEGATFRFSLPKVK